jgi:hypothetical protein
MERKQRKYCQRVPYFVGEYYALVKLDVYLKQREQKMFQVFGIE